LHGADVKELKVEIVRNLSHDLRFADAARTPDVQRHTFADQRMKRLVKLGWFHLGLPQAKYWFGCEERPVDIGVPGTDLKIQSANCGAKDPLCSGRA
jgi:hypothetical protein